MKLFALLVSGNEILCRVTLIMCRDPSPLVTQIL